MLHKLLAILLLFLLVPASFGENYENRLTPRPQRLEGAWRCFPLGDANWQIVLAGPEHELLKLGKETLQNALIAAANPAVKDAARFTIRCGVLDDAGIEAELTGEDLVAWKFRLPPQGYLIRVKDGGIVVAGRDRRGAYYGLMSLAQLAEAGELPVANLVDYPVWQRRYAGDYRFGSFEEYRRLSEDKIGGFAIQWRVEWYKLEPERLQAEFAAIRRAGELEMMDFMLLIHLYALSDFSRRATAEYFNCTDPVQMDRLISQIHAAAASGVKHVMILFDDWTPLVDGRYVSPNPEERAYFDNSVGKAHAYLMNRLAEALLPEFPELELSLCPPIYSLAYAEAFSHTEEYFRDFHTSARPEIGMVWTGPECIGPRVDKESYDRFSRYVPGRSLFQWNNSDCLMPQLPVWQDQFYPGFHHDSGGRIFLNIHTLSWLWNRPYVRTANDYLWNPAGYDADRSFDAANRRLFGAQNVTAIRRFRQLLIPLDAANAANDGSRLQALLPAALKQRELLERQGVDTSEFNGYFRTLELFAARRNPEVTLPICADQIDIAALTPEILNRCTAFELVNNMASETELLKTEVRGGIFGNRLLLVFDMERPALDQVAMPPEDERDGEIYHNPELVEIFLQPRSPGSYVHFSFDVFGHRGIEINRGDNRDWQPDFQFRIERQADSWRGIVAMPLAELEMVNPITPAENINWRFNLLRTPAQSPVAAFSPLNGFSAHTPQLFGVMKFKDCR